MKKLLITLLVVVVAYLAVAIGAWCIVPRMIANTERRLSGVRFAIANLEQDQILLSERIKAATDSTLKRGQSKADEIAALLSDSDVNHLALVYLGSDWAIQRSGFMGTVSHMRELLALQEKERAIYASRTEKKIKELESRWRTLNRNLSLLHPESIAFAAMEREIREVKEQLNNYRYSNVLYSEETRRDNDARKFAEVRAKTEAEIFRIASDYQERTVGVLNSVMAEKLGELRYEANKPDYLRRIMSPFNIWPMNVICEMSVPDTYEKQL